MKTALGGSTGMIQAMWEIPRSFNQCCLNSVDVCMENIFHDCTVATDTKGTEPLHVMCTSADNN